jgi:nucleoside-triphosphatase
MDKKNIFLTGNLHVGKSTIVNNVLARLNISDVGGYRTEAIFEHGKKVGFKMISFSGEEEIFAHVDFDKGDRFDIFRVQLQVFETFASEILIHALDHSQLIVMDEIGAMEKKSRNFQKAIAACLDSKIVVLGVFQKRADWIEEMLRDRDDVAVFKISKQNREIMQEKVLQFLISVLKRN